MAKLIIITEKQWNAIPSDYRGIATVDPERAGKRQVFAGCIEQGGGTVLLTEGEHFKIAKKSSRS